MADVINAVKIGSKNYSIDASTLGGSAPGSFVKGSITQTINSASTSTEVPSAQCVYTMIGDLETILKSI